MEGHGDVLRTAGDDINGHRGAWKSGKPVEGVWGSPAGNTPKYWFNFTNAAAAAWWEETFVGTALRNDAFDGVYTDCSCEDPPGVEAAVLLATRTWMTRLTHPYPG